MRRNPFRRRLLMTSFRDLLISSKRREKQNNAIKRVARELLERGQSVNDLDNVPPVRERSRDWAITRKSHLISFPTCAACGGTHKLQVHHILPFACDPKLELDRRNIITLCGTEFDGCHG